MTIKQYLYDKRMHVKDFAILVDHSRSYVSGVLHGRIMPGKKFARIVEKITQGEIKAEEILTEQKDE